MRSMPRSCRPISQVFDCPPIDRDMRRFVDWVSAYTLSPPGMVARMLLRAPAAFDPEPWIEGLKRTATSPDRMTAARPRVLDASLGRLRLDALRAGARRRRVVDCRRRAEGAGRVRDGDDPAAPGGRGAGCGLRARRTCRRTSRASPTCCGRRRSSGGSSVTLIDGVTGSGKTEVYFEAVAAALEKDHQVLILLPEIALTHAFLERFQDRFGAKPGEWHSDLAPRMRERVWRQVAEGSGAGGRRRALGAVPAVQQARTDRRRRGARPGLQAGGPRLLQCPRHGGGARPYQRLSRRARLGDAVDREPGQRHAGPLCAGQAAGRFADAAMPDLRAIDMRRTPPARGRFLSPVLVSEIGKTLGARRAVAAVPQPARLCAADALPGLRPPLPVSRTARAGWSSTVSAAS